MPIWLVTIWIVGGLVTLSSLVLIVVCWRLRHGDQEPVPRFPGEDPKQTHMRETLARVGRDALHPLDDRVRRVAIGVGVIASAIVAIATIVWEWTQ